MKWLQRCVYSTAVGLDRVPDEIFEGLSDFQAREAKVTLCGTTLFFVIYPEQVAEFDVWRPIETAPKDGRWILLYVPDPGDCLVPCGIVPAKWVGALSGWTTRGICGIDATHWMPLPKEPK